MNNDVKQYNSKRKGMHPLIIVKKSQYVSKVKLDRPRWKRNQNI